MARSVRVVPHKIEELKLALHRKAFPSQMALATEVGLSKATVSNYLRGKPVDYLNFVEISDKLGLDWQEIADVTTLETLSGGRYKIIKLLGSHEFAETYMVEDKHFPKNPLRVLKQLKSESSNAQITREAEVLSQLSNDYRIPTLQEFRQEGQSYLVRDWVEGIPLSDELLEGQRWPEKNVTDLLLEILEVLDIFHQHEIILRNVNPQNLIRRQKDDKIVPIGFGTVRPIGTGQTRTFADNAQGYIPPEQGYGSPGLCSDIYAVGTIGIQALTGLRPSKLKVNSNTGNVVWRNEAQVSSKFADVLDKMVCYDFKVRYQSAAEARDDLLKC